MSASKHNSSKDMILQAIKQQYCNAESFGINQHNALQPKSHQPILISNFIKDLKSQIAQNKATLTYKSSSSQHIDQPSPYSNTLDGFFLLEKSHVDFPDHIASINVSSQDLGSVAEDDMPFFTSLLYLDVSDNHLSLSSFSSLPKLQELRLTCNNIQDIPHDDISHGFPTLSILDLSYNNLYTDSIRNLYLLPSLRQLDLSGNGLTSLPSEMFQFTGLDKLILTHNQFADDKIFIILSYIPKLRIVNLAYNYLSEFIAEASDCSDQFKYLETLDVSFNYFAVEESLLPILLPKNIQELIIYGNPVLGPTGDDPHQIYIDSLVNASLLPSKHGRQHAVEIITDIPHDRIPNPGKPLARHAKYRKFNITKTKSEATKSNRQWRQEGSRSLFAEAMTFIKHHQQTSSTSLNPTSLSLSLAGDAFFITEVEMKQEILSSQAIADKVMDQIAVEMRLTEDHDIDDLEKQLHIQSYMVPDLIQEIQQEYDHEYDDDHHHMRHEMMALPLSPAAMTPSSKANVSSYRNNRDEEKKSSIMNNSSKGYKMPLNSAIHALKFAVNHPLTNYYEVPAKGFLPSWSYIQPNAAYEHRKVSKYDSSDISSSQHPPMIISSNTKTISKRKPHHTSSYSKSSSLQANGRASLSRSSPIHHMMDDKHAHHHDRVAYQQLDEVLSDLNHNTQDIISKPPGQGQNLKENIVALKRFVRPATGLQGLASMVGQVLQEFDT